MNVPFDAGVWWLILAVLVVAAALAGYLFGVRRRRGDSTAQASVAPDEPAPSSTETVPIAVEPEGPPAGPCSRGPDPREFRQTPDQPPRDQAPQHGRQIHPADAPTLPIPVAPHRVPVASTRDRQRLAPAGAAAPQPPGSDAVTLPNPMSVPASPAPRLRPDDTIGDDEDRPRLSKSAIDALIAAYDGTPDESLHADLGRRLEDAGIHRMVPAVHSPFDPEVQRCVATEPAPTPELSGLVLRTVRPGWQLTAGRVIRVPEVAVWKTPGQADF